VLITVLGTVVGVKTRGRVRVIILYRKKTVSQTFDRNTYSLGRKQQDF
jgi:hypothetical protein